MIGSTRNVRVWAYTAPMDLRKGYDGLYGTIIRHMGKNPLCGDCFLFTNRNRKRAKVLLWDGTGLCIFMKRLEKGHFAKLWQKGDGSSLEMTISELALFLEGSPMVGRIPLSPEKFMLYSVDR